MTDPMTPAEAIAKESRWASTARTWVQKAAALLRYNHKQASTDEMRWVVGYDAARFLDELIGAAETLVPLLNDEDDYQLNEVHVAARNLAAAIRSRGLVRKLSHTTGRTPQEAESFARKARELTERK